VYTTDAIQLKEAPLVIEEPRIVQTEPLHFAGLHLRIPVAEIQKTMGAGLAEVSAALQARHTPPTGPWFTHHYVRPMEFFDFKICFPVAEPFPGEGRVEPGIWPAMPVARTVFHGNYSGLPAAWGELEAWMKQNGHTGGTEFWERYTVGPDSDPKPENWRTELNWPLA
jgi:effector-binding domain-containing protein